MKFGLTDHEFAFLEQHLVTPLKEQNAKVFIFGSRAKGTHHKFSDIDVLYAEHPSSPVSRAKITEIEVFFEESSFPYKIDLVNSKNLAHSFVADVERTKVEI